MCIYNKMDIRYRWISVKIFDLIPNIREYSSESDPLTPLIEIEFIFEVWSFLK